MRIFTRQVNFIKILRVIIFVGKPRQTQILGIDIRKWK